MDTVKKYMKKCKNCLVEKELSDFYTHPRTKD